MEKYSATVRIDYIAIRISPDLSGSFPFKVESFCPCRPVIDATITNHAPKNLKLKLVILCLVSIYKEGSRTPSHQKVYPTP